MHRCIKYILLLLIGHSSTVLYAQKNTAENMQIIETMIEEIAGNTDEDLDYTALMEDLTYFLEYPLNLNTASEEDLAKLHFLSDFQIQSLLIYREKFGNLLTIYELQLLNGFASDAIFRLLPFVTVAKGEESSNFSIKKVLKYGKNQLFVRTQRVIEEQKGYTPISDEDLANSPNSRYLGSPWKVYSRYSFTYKKKISCGFTTEKDAGEEFFQGSQRQGFDYYSAHLQVNEIGPFQKVILGDYQVQFGQGLTLSSGLGIGKSPDVLNIKKKAQKIRKYSSTDENRFLRGVATTYAIKDIELTAFYSKKKIDANVTLPDSLDDPEERYISSIQSSGLHSTASEILDKHAISEVIFGGNVSYHGKFIKTGLTWVDIQYGADLIKDTNQYNQYDFRGTENYNMGLDYQFNIKNISFFGEAAVCRNGGKAFVNGAILPMGSQVSISVLHRRYDKEYFAFYGDGFAESKTANENGLYIGAQIYPYKRWKLSGYFDAYKFPWLKSGVYAPSNGVDYFVQADFNASRKVEMYIRYKRETKPKNASEGAGYIRPLMDATTTKIRYNLDFSASNAIQLKNRLEYVIYESEGTVEQGYLIYQDIIYRPEKLPLRLAFRYGLFDAPYDARIYAYEYDVLYGFSIPAYSNKGVRYYLTLSYEISDNLDIWLRFARFSYSDKTTIGSGLTEISGSDKTEVKMQIRWKF